jgi:hypothetical protein
MHSPCLLLNPPADTLLHISHTTRPRRLSPLALQGQQGARVGRNPFGSVVLAGGHVLVCWILIQKPVARHKPQKTCVCCVCSAVVGLLSACDSGRGASFFCLVCASVAVACDPRFGACVCVGVVAVCGIAEFCDDYSRVDCGTPLA